MPDARGDVLCPTCGRWTPPAPFCNECGAALQGGTRDSVGGQGSNVFRRGHEVDTPGAPWSGRAERFEPEPEDQAARAAAAARAAGGLPIDHLAEPEAEVPAPSWPAEPGLAGGEVPPTAPTGEPPPDETTATETPAAVKAAAAAALAAAAVAPAAGAPDSAAVAAAATPPRRSRASTPPPVDELPPPTVPPRPPSPPAPADSNGGVSGLVFVVFLGIGILALLGGAIIGGVFDADPVAEGSPSPTAEVATPSPEPTPEASTAEPSPTTAAPSAAPSNAQPSAFPDGFLARAETCDEQPTSETCGNSGAVNDGELWILVSFRHAKPSDVIGVRIFDISGELEGESSLELSFCGTNTDCPGYTFFGFNNLGPGAYNVRVDRNGTLAATTTFTVQ